MKRELKQLIIGIVIVVALVGAWFLIRYFNNKQSNTEETETMSYQMLELSIDDISAFSYTNNGTELSFQKGSSGWVYEADDSVDLNDDLVTNIVNTAASLSAYEEITDYDDISEYGLDNPQMEVQLTSNDGVTVIEIGDYNDMLGRYYAKLKDSDTVYMIGSSLPKYCQDTIDDLKATE